ncbi:histone-like nucleoid-structuring protein Lsr2 [Demequina lignilytica]|uniref:Lsr2 family protein n=1 Tax=Demequina lignilytica TaxID=3051663 RepID=A0AAW7M4B1_9MICO|nr:MULTISPECIES: Lsr2 family protein [unclassified Demequina]MDN4477479.1 Lsr2 family protein [Demequina sp. SYSU T00039-1]MDN4484222.1 Lsr2 family protein [Demequina sp. SYSU T0a273]MDN4488170.1 Lsr2 family protein [Demequina sp. SYSU T00039]MDN4490611.1 Lsr2 family protein [Demequina sp. SYSU T00068]
MAQKVQVVLVDDIDGSTADETIAFSLDGTSYEIDLNSTHAKEFRDAVAPWISAGRRMNARKPASRARRAESRAAKASDAAEIRAWAKANGVDVPERGRIPAKVREAFDAR